MAQRGWPARAAAADDGEGGDVAAAASDTENHHGSWGPHGPGHRPAPNIADGTAIDWRQYGNLARRWQRDGRLDTVLDLQRLLHTQVGDDYIGGAVRMPTSPKPPSSSPSMRDPRGFTVTVLGSEFRFPLTEMDAVLLYSILEESALGVEGRGTTHDGALRRSKEIEVGLDKGATLPAPLDRFYFPEAVEEIRTRLCPDAARVGVVAHKLIMYGPGDFFTRHVDTPANAHHLATVVVNLPTVANYNTLRPAVSFAEDPAGPHAVAEVMRAGRRHLPSEGAATFDADKAARSGGSEGGLHLYMHREVSDAPFCSGPAGCANEQDDSGHPRKWASSADRDAARQRAASNGGGYDPPTTEQALEVVADLTSYAPAALAPRNNDGDGGSKPPTLPLNYAAWLTDVEHEVLPVVRGFRVVVSYKFFKRGHARIRIPLFDPIQSALSNVFAALARLSAAHRKECATNEILAGRVSWCPACRDGPDSLGVLLRHLYPPAALVPESLKGLDAVVFRVASHRRDCYLTSAVLCRDTDTEANPWRCDEVAFGRAVFATTDPERKLVAVARQSYDPQEAVARHYPAIVRCAWVQLGHGRLVTGGSSYGNHDCTAPWWYRSAALIVRPEKSDWRRRRWVFVIQHLSGTEHWRTLMTHWYVQRVIAEFL